ncbi:MAG: trypsin-like peptidase domain-containing protein [Chloroflexi bacterium]|nr:trypsin-like peptidase domain-containing protein [Chloroflexota bacterium]
MSVTFQQLNAEMASGVENARRALVQVHHGRRGTGAGTIWHPEGLIITNAHVVSGGPLRVTLPDGVALPARLLSRDPDLDLAALMVDASGLPTIEVGNSRDIRPGQWVMALGHPFGVKGAATAGVIVGTGWELPGVPISRREWIIANLSLRPGHSGGPLLDACHRLIGINTMMASPDMGLAVPVHVIKAFLTEKVGTS